MSYDADKKLTNADFRKLFMTPRHGESSSSSSSFAVPSTPTSSSGLGTPKDKDRRPKDKEKDEKRRKKKHFYAKIKKEEDDQMAELARKYRDRAKERREGDDPVPRDDLISAQGAYRAVAPDFRGNVDAAERRKQLIQESKFLGGDMEHTHLVKGLDYALLQKVRSELDAINEEGFPELPDEKKEKEKEKEKKKEVAKAEESQEDNDALGGFHTKLGRNIHRVVFKSALPDRNELFAPGRMAYVMDLEDEYAESDIPTTLIRSKADVPNAEGQATLTTNDIVINKLAQILSYLRQGSKSSKKHKKSREARVEKPLLGAKEGDQNKREEDSIYGDIGDYVPNSKSKSHKGKHDGKDRSKHQYFEKPKEDDELILTQNLAVVDESSKNRNREAWQDGDAANRPADQTFGAILKQNDKSMSRAQKLMSKINSQPEGYAECYPGFDEMHDAIEDSDEETDYSKMDPGKKKGAVGRWDFDTQEEYSEYMSNKEALPKAAFQFGVKMNDGRKTRKGNKSEKNEKAQLERQWQQIQAIMHKRKGGKADGESEPKTPKM